jgi:hypothetical protein
VPERWLPTDSRQREIHRLLLLVGGEPAAFFLDTCRLMDGDYRLEATTHVVGHLLRELDHALRAVLRPIVPGDRWPPRNSPDANGKQVEAICDALGIANGDPFRAFWCDYARPLHGWAHRYSRAAPRPVDERFREVWVQGQIVVHRLAQRIEANYTLALPLVDNLAAGTPDVERFRQEFLHSTVALDRFYQRASVDWLEPLRREGVFASAPALVYADDGTISYSRWPAGRFLARIAPVAPAAVIDIGLALDTDNPEAHESLLDAALAIDANEAARLVPHVERWLQMPGQWQLPFKTRELVTHLINGGQLNGGLGLLRALINSCVERNQHLDSEIVREATTTIFPAAGVAGLELLAELLTTVRAMDHERDHDFSRIWRPYLANQRRHDLRDALVSALRDGADQLVTDQPDLLNDVLELLESREQSIFHRLALDLLTRHPDSELIPARLTQRKLFDNLNTEREYDALVGPHFADLSASAKREILGFVESGPERGREDTDYADRWQLQMLARIPELPHKWQQRRDELSSRYGKPEPQRLPEFGYVRPPSPLVGEQLATMSDEDLLGFLRDWQPPEAEWQAPSREGLARALRALVVADPERFAALAPCFAGLDPTYAHALVGGLREVRTNGGSFLWPPVLEFALAVLGNPRRVAERDQTGFDGNDPGWTWTWQELAHLIGIGFEGQGAIPAEAREHVWEVLSRLAQDEHPRAEDERDEDGRDGPQLLAASSVRGCAFEAVAGYIWWLRGDEPAADRRMPEEAKELLDRHLDPDIEPTLAVHSLYGKWFPYLATADPTWAATRVDKIFPRKPERLWRASWDSYLYFNGVWETVFRQLADQYRQGIDALTAEREGAVLLGDVGTALVNHLMTAYRYGMTDFGDGTGLLERFYELASLERRAQAIESIGLALTDGELTDAMSVRLCSLWERRLAAVRHPNRESATEELRGFGLWFVSGRLEASWSLQQLVAVVNAGGRIDSDHAVAERLANLRESHLAAVLHALDLLIDAGTTPWFVIGARDDIEIMLVSGLTAEGEPAERAREIVNRLVARGHVDFERLLIR